MAVEPKSRLQSSRKIGFLWSQAKTRCCERLHRTCRELLVAISDEKPWPVRPRHEPAARNIIRSTEHRWAIGPAQQDVESLASSN